MSALPPRGLRPASLPLLALLSVLPAAAQSGDVGLEAYSAMTARSIGPAGMSGRVTAIQAVESDPSTIYIGTATGGMWKTTDDGLTWTTLFDEQPVASIGSIAIRQASPDVVWVGTGEGNPRNSASVGNGVFRSLDGGQSWTPAGLEGTEKIHRLLLHPTDPDTAWAAAMGTSWGENPERGVFKTIDGGANWERVLFVDERTGCADLVIDPSNPDKLVAAMWDHRREPWFFRSGGPGSGLYVTLDGGATWTQRTSDDGLPSGELGRMGLGFCREHPEVLYALVEAEESALLRSDDGGFSFRTVNDDRGVASRPFYYADIRVDPKNPNRLYSLASGLSFSDDGGRTFQRMGAGVHPDHHAMWINPSDPDHILEGNDGGMAITRNGGSTWRFVRNLPLAQYYHIAVDLERPYNVYGGMQDNGSWRGPNTVWENGGIRNHHWQEVGFGDGFATLPMPDDALRGYAMSQGGSLMRWNAVTGERKGIKPDGPEAAEGEEDIELRFNWNAGIALDPFDDSTLYYGSQFVHRSTDRGDSWETISGDLTSNNPEWQRQEESGGLTPDVTGAENYCTIMTIAPSSLEQGLLWVGTDDGRLHLTRDGGQTWVSLEENFLGVPRNTWIPHVEASKHDAATAYVVLDDHRRATWEPYVFKTTDHGATWTNLATPNLWGYVHVIEEDPVDPNLLFLGTEFHMYVSRDGGQSWHKWNHGIPTCPVRALQVHPRDHDLVIGTFGRAAYVIDDIRPLRNRGEEAADAADTALYLSEIPPCVQYQVKQTGESRFPGGEEFRGETRPRGALISFFVGDDEDLPKEVEVSFLDAEGEVVREFGRAVEPGLNRFSWDLRQKGFDTGGGGRFRGFRGGGGESTNLRDKPGGPDVLPGTYTLRLTMGEHTAEGAVEVLADPRVDISLADRALKIAAIRRAGALSEVLGEVTKRIDRVRADVEFVKQKAEEAKDDDAPEDAEHPQQALLDAVEAFEKALDAVDEELRGPREGGRGINRRDTVSSRVRRAAFGMAGWDAPTAGELRRIDEAEEDLREIIEKVNTVLDEDLKVLREAFLESGIQFLDGGDANSID